MQQQMRLKYTLRPLKLQSKVVTLHCYQTDLFQHLTRDVKYYN